MIRKRLLSLDEECDDKPQAEKKRKKQTNWILGLCLLLPHEEARSGYLARPYIFFLVSTSTSLSGSYLLPAKCWAVGLLGFRKLFFQVAFVLWSIQIPGVVGSGEDRSPVGKKKVEAQQVQQLLPVVLSKATTKWGNLEKIEWRN